MTIVTVYKYIYVKPKTFYFIISKPPCSQKETFTSCQKSKHLGQKTSGVNICEFTLICPLNILIVDAQYLKLKYGAPWLLLLS
jgi:hypothetical protein